MAKDLTVWLEDRPGTLAEVGEAAARAGINIDGVAGFEVGGRGILHVLVGDASAARQAFQAAGLEVTDEREVLVLGVEDRPGVLGETARKIADAGVNIDLLYLAAGTRLVIGADNLDAAREAV
ncbi:MAG: ACT domain-containing protein [Actinomycetota bacterium]|nr:ACT domain-containing protein [Actinomycetota bacterium]